MKELPRVFVSYRRDDSAYVTAPIHERLVEALGKDNVFMDVDNIPAGRDFRVHLQMAINASDVCVAVIGESWLGATNAGGKRRLDDESDFVRLEIEAALGRDIPVIPLLVGKADLPTAAQLPESLAALTYRQALRIRPGSDYRRDVQELLNQITSIDASARRTGAFASEPEGGPGDGHPPGSSTAAFGPMLLLRRLWVGLVARPALAFAVVLLALAAVSLLEVLLAGAEGSENTSLANWATMFRPFRYVVYTCVGVWVLIAARSWLGVLRPHWPANSRRRLAIGLAFLGEELTPSVIRFGGFQEGFFAWLPWDGVVSSLLVVGAVALLGRQLPRGAVGLVLGLGGFGAGWLAFAAMLHFVDGTTWPLAFLHFTTRLLILLALIYVEGRMSGVVVGIAAVESWRLCLQRALLGVVLLVPLGLVAYLWLGQSFGDSVVGWLVTMGAVGLAITAIALAGHSARAFTATSSERWGEGTKWLAFERANALVYLLFLLVVYSLAPLVAGRSGVILDQWAAGVSWLAASLAPALVGVLARESWPAGARYGPGVRQDWLGCAFAVVAALVVRTLFLATTPVPHWLLSAIWGAQVYWSMSVLPRVAATRFQNPSPTASRRWGEPRGGGDRRVESAATVAAETTHGVEDAADVTQIPAGELRAVNALRLQVADSWTRVRQAAPEPGLAKLLQQGENAFHGMEGAFGSRAYAEARMHGETLVRVCEQIREIEARRELAKRERCRAMDLQAKAGLFEAKRLASHSWQAVEHFTTIAEASFGEGRFELARDHWREARRELAVVVNQAQALRRLEVKTFVAGIEKVLDGNLPKEEARATARSLADASNLSATQAKVLILFTRSARKSGGRIKAHEVPEATLCELLACNHEGTSLSGGGLVWSASSVWGWALLALYAVALVLTFAADVSSVTSMRGEFSAWLVASRVAAIGATFLIIVATGERASGRLLVTAAVVSFGLMFGNLGVFAGFAVGQIAHCLGIISVETLRDLGFLHLIGVTCASGWCIYFATRMRGVAPRRLLEDMIRWMFRCSVICAAALVGHEFFSVFSPYLPLRTYWEITLLGSMVVAALPSAALWVGRRVRREAAATVAEQSRSVSYVSVGVVAVGGAVACQVFGLSGPAVGVGYLIVAFTLIALASARTAA